MRLRATRLTAASNPRRRLLDPARLFQTAGRVGVCYTSDTGGVSWDDLIAENMRALGPERIVNGGFDSDSGWFQSDSSPSTSTISGGLLTITSNGSTRARRRQTLTVEVGKTYAVQCIGFTGIDVWVGNSVGSGDILSSSAVSGSTTVYFVAPASTVYLQLSRQASGTFVADNISVREIDLSKCSLYHDSAGTVPVVYPIAAGQGMGFLRDRSAGSELGAELVSDPELANNNTPAEWSSAGTGGANTIVFSGGAVTFTTDGTNMSINKAGALLIGKWYEARVSVSAQSGVVPGLFTGSADVGFSAGTGDRRLIFAAAATTLTVKCVGATAGSFTLESISVRPLPGYPLSQPTLSARGEFSRRYNLLEGSEALTGWTTLGLLPNTTAPAPIPDGSLTGTRIVESTASSAHYAQLIATVVAGVSYKLTFRVRGVGQRNRFTVLAARSTTPFTNHANTVFDLQTGQILNAFGSDGALNDLGDGCFECSVIYTPETTGEILRLSLTIAGTNTIYVGDGVSGADVFGVDNRPTADAHIGKPYQRVTTASDYDEEGFPTYLRRQTDDWARAFAVNPNGATKALCFWVGQKMSDAAAAVAFETSPTSTGNFGVLALFTPANNGVGNIAHRSGGSQLASVPAALSAAPARVAVRTQSDITNDVNQLHINGSLAASATADQGTGTYLAYDLFEGARAGTSLFSNTRTYTPPLLMFIQPDDPGPTASEIARLEAKYLRAAGVL